MNNGHSFMMVRLGAIAALSYGAQATVIYVPADQPTIQDAINVAVNGDTVRVASGGYAESISFLGKEIEVRAEQDDDPTLTVIDGSGFGAVAAWVAGEGRDTKLVGFTLQNAVLEGVAIINSSPTIVRCRMVNNGGGAVAHGAVITDGSPLFRECRFVGTAIASGIGASIVGGSPEFYNCLFKGNLVAGVLATDCVPSIQGCVADGNGMGVLLNGTLGPTLAGIGNSTIVNSAIAGIQLENTGNAVAAVVANCIVRNNASAVVTVGPNAGMIARYSNIEGGFPGPGNIDLPAGFVDGPGGDYHLGAASPCVDAGDNNFVASDLTIDPDGTPRFLDDFGAADTGLGSAPIVDMGAYERKHPIRLVDGTATGGDHGLTWTDAYVDLQDALDEAASGEVEEVWVAAGTYLPDRGTGDRTLSFNMRSGVAIIGGFAGVETDAAARDPIAYATTLGGAIGASGTADNSYHVVRADNVDSTGKLIGFIVQRGNADGPQATFDNRGGGLFIDGGGPTVRECRIRLNTCAAFGAGVFCEDADPEFGRCRVNLNESAGDGGGMAFFSSEPLIVDCSVNGNAADDEAGGLVFYSNSIGEIVNCSVTGNAAPTAPTGGLQISGGSAVTVRNTVLWGNTGTSAFPQTQQLRVLAPGTLDIGSSTVEGWTGSLGGTANSGDDPLFVDIDGPDDVFGTADDDTHLLPGSPCIDSADASALPAQVSLDLAGDPRYLDDPGTPDSGLGMPSYLDRGCYEFQGTTASPCPADLDGNGLVDGADLGLLLANWGGAGSGDLDGSGTIDGADLGLLLAAWGNC